jgi:hypothetical protein
MIRTILLAFASCLLTVQISLGQDWTIIPVDKEGNGSTEIHTEVNGNEIHYLCKGGWGQLFYYFSSDAGKSWELQYTIKITHRTFEIGELSSAIDQNGVYHMAYFDPGNNVIHATKQSATTWISDTVCKNTTGDWDAWHRLFLEVDSKNGLHLLRQDDNNLLYFVNKGNGWQSKTVTNFKQTNIDEYSFCIDAKGILHIVANTYDGELLHMYSADGTTWKTELAGLYNSADCIDIKADNEGGIHMVFMQDEDAFEGRDVLEGCTYAHRDALGKWEKVTLEKVVMTAGEKAATYRFYAYDPSIDVDEKGGVHIAYVPIQHPEGDELPGDTLVYAYRKKGAKEFTFDGVPCADKWYGGVDVNAEKGKIYYSYIGIVNGQGRSSGLLLAMAPYKPDEEPEDSILENRIIDVQAEVEIINSTITLDLWDNGEIDGDELSIWLDDQLILDAYVLKAEHKEIILNLEKGKTYNLSVVAISEGEFPPCTAVVNVVDGTNTTTITLVSDTQKNGTLRLTVN